ncbi:hypothetical protein ABT173_46775 [Streptomyces sp. NPDC001795]|uniref:hypothetical protein n=1 Tax=unclassified Streptomyces TaxID=2593676 RepID=UPI00331BC07C
MTLHWNHVRIHAPERTGAGGISRPQPPGALAELVRDVRAADPANRWFFHWADDCEQAGIDLWAGVAPGVSQEMERRFSDVAPELGVPPENTPAFGEFRVSATRRPRALEIEFGDDVAMASSELALAVMREPALDYRAQLTLAVWHLRHVVALIGESGRRGFLFQCWQHRTARLTPAQRTELCARSAEAVGVFEEGLPAMGPDAERGWDGYLRTLRRNAQAWAAEDVPVNYLLFEHSHLTLRRLRVPPSVEALAARTVRAALTPSGADRRPIAVPRAVLQTA